MADVEVSEQVAAPPEQVYELVSDLPRMGEWSPENSGGRWLGDSTGPAVGARFKGRNRHGWRRWSTACRVTTAEPGREFAFEVSYGPMRVGHWGYRLEPTASGCEVTEYWSDGRPGWFRRIYPLLMGIDDRDAVNRQNMQATLRALKATAEQQQVRP